MDREYWGLWEQSYQLKHHSDLSFLEQELMPAEVRKWWFERLNKDAKEQAEKPGRIPHVSKPSLRRKR